MLLPMLTGVCHSGRFSGKVRIAPAASGEREYTAAFQLAGVDFGRCSTSSRPSRTARPPPRARGLLDAELTLGGLVDAPETRRGRGSFRVTGKDVRVLNLPGILPLIEVSNLQLPANDSLDYAEASFFVDAGLISFERLAVYSRDRDRRLRDDVVARDRAGPAAQLTLGAPDPDRQLALSGHPQAAGGHAGARHVCASLRSAWSRCPTPAVCWGPSSVRRRRSPPPPARAGRARPDAARGAARGGGAAGPVRFGPRGAAMTAGAAAAQTRAQPAGARDTCRGQSAAAGAGCGSRACRADDPEIAEKLDRMIEAVGGERRFVRWGGLSVKPPIAGLKLIPDGGEHRRAEADHRRRQGAALRLPRVRPVRRAAQGDDLRLRADPPEHPDYVAAVEFGRLMAQRRWMVITGAGDGIMKAGHVGPGREASFGARSGCPSRRRPTRSSPATRS